jgi:hypothetical protein
LPGGKGALPVEISAETGTAIKSSQQGTANNDRIIALSISPLPEADASLGAGGQRRHPAHPPR